MLSELFDKPMARMVRQLWRDLALIELYHQWFVPVFNIDFCMDTKAHFVTSVAVHLWDQEVCEFEIDSPEINLRGSKMQAGAACRSFKAYAKLEYISKLIQEVLHCFLIACPSLFLNILPLAFPSESTALNCLIA